MFAQMVYYVLLPLIFLPLGISQDVVPANFPDCANDCLSNFTNSTSTGNCLNADSACICADSSFQDGWACCVNTGCGESDERSAIGTMKSQCPDTRGIGECSNGRDPATGFGFGRGGNRFGGGRFRGGGGNGNGDGDGNGGGNGDGNGDGDGDGGGGGNGGNDGQDAGQSQAPPPDPVTVTEPPITIVSPVTVINPVTVVSPVTIDNPITVSAPAETTAAIPFSTLSPVPAPQPTATSVFNAPDVVIPSSTTNADVLSTSAPPLLASTSASKQDTISGEPLATSAVTPPTTLLSNTLLPTGTGAPAFPVLDPTETSAPRPAKPLTDGLKAGVAIAVLVTVALIAAGIYFFVRWRKRTFDKEFKELKEQHEADRVRPKSQPLPVYPRTDTTVVGGVGAYRDTFDKPGIAM